MIDLNSLSDQELEAIASGNLESLSDETLTIIAGSGQQSSEPQPSIPFTQTGNMKLSDLVTPRLGSRLLGTPEGMTAGQQFKQLYDRSQDAVEMPYSERFLNSFATGVAGDVVDMSLNPLTYIVGAATKYGTPKVLDAVAKNPYGKKILGTLTKDVTKLKVSDFLPDKKPNLESLVKAKDTLNLQTQTTQALNEMMSQDLTSEAASKFSAEKVRIGNEINVLGKELSSKADDATLASRDAALNYWKDLNSRFSKDYLEAGKSGKIAVDQEFQILDKTLNESGINAKIGAGAKLSTPEKAFYEHYLNVKKTSSLQPTSEFVDEFGVVIKRNTTPQTRPIMNFDKDIQSLFAKGDEVYSNGDNILTILRKNTADTLKEFKAVRAKYRPEYQAKNEMFKIFKPFNRSGDFDTTTGTNLLKRAFSGKASPDEMRLVKTLEKQNPNLFNELKAVQANKESLVKQMSDLQAKHLDDVKSIQSDAQKSTLEALVEQKEKGDLLDSMIAKAKVDESKKILRNSLIKKGAGLLGAGTLAGLGFELAKRVPGDK